MYFSLAGNSQSRAVHALLIATPTVAATRELVSEGSWSLLFLYITLKETLFRQCKQTFLLVSSARLQPFWSENLQCSHPNLYACLQWSTTLIFWILYNSRTYMNNNNHHTEITSQRCGYFAVPFMQPALAICVKLMSDLLRQQLL